MILQCNSCQKSFVVPDSAITEQGRLVQCSACGNKWRQFPIFNQKTIEKKTTNIPLKVKQIKKETKIKNKNITKTKKVKKREINLYSTEYLQKKHGIKIINPSREKTKIKRDLKVNRKFGFYNFILTLIVFIIFLFGLLNHTREIIIFNFPFLESYISHFYDSINYLKIIFFDIFSRY
tara:strand:+ start:102 stop:635 length:534 start_codon:yes stop_codon:yes gene_type:complete